MSKKLWEASEARKKNSNLYRYENFLSKNTKFLGKFPSECFIFTGTKKSLRHSSKLRF